VNALESRLHAELGAESELITPESIPPLSLPGRNHRRVPKRSIRGGRRWPVWLTPLAAAAAVLAVVAGTLTATRVFSSAPARQPTTGTSYSHLPPYYAVTVSGNVVSYTYRGTQYSSSVLGRSIQIRATATGKLVATVRPPAPYNDFAVLTATPDGQTFVFGAERYWGFRGATSPLTGALDSAAPLRFVLLRITPAGGVSSSALSLPLKVLPGQQPSIALSPDGTGLAVAYGGGGQAAIVRVITLATGQVRQWQWPHVPWTPQIQGQGAWTADGRTLVLQQRNVVRGAAGKAPAQDTPANTTPVWLVDTAAPNGAVTPGKPLTLRAPAGLSAPWEPFITPDGSELVATSETGTRGLLPGGTSTGEFAAYSARTGALIRTLAPWTWTVSRPRAGNRFPGPAVAWSDMSGSQLLVLQPRDGLNRLGVLTGGRVVLTGSNLLPSQPEAYAALQAALQNAAAVPPHMTW
jgi:hypothetical protein